MFPCPFRKTHQLVYNKMAVRREGAIGGIPPRPCETIGASVAVAGLLSAFVDIFLFSFSLLSFFLVVCD